MISSFLGGIIASPWIRAALRYGTKTIAIVLFLLLIRRAGERTGRLTERLEITEKANDIQRRMLEAAARRVWCHHSRRNWSGDQIRQRCSRGREARPTADRSRCSETTQPPTCSDASPVPLVRDAHAASM